MSDKSPKPTAFIRRWALDGEKPEKERNDNGRMVWPVKFKFLPVTQSQCLRDDEPLFTADQVGTALSQAKALITECQAALAEELAAWDIDPPLHHVKQAHDRCTEWLAAHGRENSP
jgi:acetoin utilization deacetylase AcuC-like enzyme